MPSDIPNSDTLEMLTVLLRSLVDNPEDVEVQGVALESSISYQVRANPTDMGKLIGVNGRTARALRIILGANAARLKQNLSLDILQRENVTA